MRACVRASVRCPILNDPAQYLENEKGSFGHGSIGHHQPQRPVPRGFPLFKRSEWLVFNRFVSKRRPPLEN